MANKALHQPAIPLRFIAAGELGRYALKGSGVKVIIPACLIGLALASFQCPARAGLLEEACDLAHRQLSSVPKVRLDKSTGSFSDNGRSYHGCIVRLTGN